MQIKEEMDRMIKDSFFCERDKEIYLHPCVITDCIKSLIGLDLKNPNKELMVWNKHNLENSGKIKFKESKYEAFEMVSYSALQQAFFDKDRNLVDRIIQKISQVSEGSQLIEFFIEMALMQTGKSLISIWRIKRLLMFCDIDNKLIAYSLIADFLFQDNFRKNCLEHFKEKKLSDLTSIAAKYDHIILYCHISDICPDAFIRSDKIIRAYSGMLKYIQNSIDSRSQYIDIKEDRIEKDRTQFIFNMKNKNSKNILLIDSLRMLVKKKPLISQDFINACFLQIQ